MTLPAEIVAALWGAGAGAVSSIGIEWARWLLHRRQRARAIKVALYYEIFGHSIIEAAPSPEGDPNFILVGFARASYDAYLDEIPDLLPEKLVGDVATYYARATTAASQQEQMEDDTVKVREAAAELARLEVRQGRTTAPIHPAEVELLKQAGEQIADRVSKMMNHNRILLAVGMGQQERLLATLREEFSSDPREKPVVVLPKYQDWIAKQVKTK